MAGASGEAGQGGQGGGGTISHLDPSFGQNGIVELPYLSAAMSIDAFALGPAGDLTVHIPGGGGLAAIARLRADGSLDPTFGDGGFVSGIGPGEFVAFKLAVQPDGKLVAGGASLIGFAVLPAFMRLNVDGSLDPSFGDNGYRYVALPEGDGRSTDMTLHEGKIYSVGSEFFSFARRALSLRVSADGSLDTSFHAPAGYDYYYPEGGTEIVEASMVGSHVAGDGSFYSCGHSFADIQSTSPFGDYNYLLLRYTPDGERDPAFGQAGAVYLDHIGAAGPFSLADNFCTGVGTTAEGKVVFGGYAASASFDGLSNFVVGRLLPDGSPDPSFGNQGIVEIDISPTEKMTDFAVLPDGRMIGAGASGTNELNPVVFVLRPDGTLDPNFGEGGVLRFPRQVVEYTPVLLEVQPDGKVLVGATAEGAFVARLIVP